MVRKFDTFEIERDLYADLGVSPDASHEELRKAYQRLAIEKHPDKNDSLNATDEFRVIQEAWECLREEVDRREYDRLRGINADGYDGYKSETDWSLRKMYARPPLFSKPQTDGLGGGRYDKFSWPIPWNGNAAVDGRNKWRHNNGVDPGTEKGQRWEAYEREVIAVQGQRKMESEEVSQTGEAKRQNGPAWEERIGW